MLTLRRIRIQEIRNTWGRQESDTRSAQGMGLLLRLLSSSGEWGALETAAWLIPSSGARRCASPALTAVALFFLAGWVFGGAGHLLPGLGHRPPSWPLVQHRSQQTQGGAGGTPPLTATFANVTGRQVEGELCGFPRWGDNK